MVTARANSTTTSGNIAAHLREEIVAGQLRAGQPLRQDELARRFGVSKIPVREALHQLKAEGLVLFLNNRGSTVSSLSASEVEEIYTMRLALEDLALTRALTRLNESDFIAAEAALKLLDVTPDASRWPALNWQFHSQLYAAAGMPLLLQTVKGLHSNVSRYLLLHLTNPKHQKTSQDEHRALLAACRQYDASAARKVLRKHLQEASTQSQRLLRQAEGDSI